MNYQKTTQEGHPKGKINFIFQQIEEKTEKNIENFLCKAIHTSN